MKALGNSSPILGTELPDGCTLHQLERVDGTNAEALRAGAPPGHVYSAKTQTAGRGRESRNWVSPEGNLYATICTEAPQNRNAGQLAFVAGLAVLDAIRDLVGNTQFSLKWPNDLLADGRKVSGILIEAGEMGYAVGIGVNIASSPPDSLLRYPATSLCEFTEKAPERGLLLSVICTYFEKWRRRWVDEGFEPLRTVWLASAHGIGDTISASIGGCAVEGRVRGLDADGALVLEDADGSVHLITAGDVFFPKVD
jgi:BirA family biotin operon repressor/biotin-[acetyl-CoA-carboxylase] ligase